MLAALILAAGIVAPPAPTNYVTDTAGALNASTVQRIDAELQRYEKATGHKIIVWIGQTTGDVPLEDYTIHAAETWKVFTKSHHDDNAILFLFMQDHKVRIEVGYGLESSLTDASSSEIIRDTIVPRMRAGDADGAVQDGVDRMLVTVTPSFAKQLGHAVASPAPDESPMSTADVIALLAIMFVVIAVVCIILIALFRRSRRGGGGFFSGWIIGNALGGSGWSGGSGGFGGADFSGGFGGGFGGGGASGSW